MPYKDPEKRKQYAREYAKQWAKSHRQACGKAKAKWLKTPNGTRWRRGYAKTYRERNLAKLSANAKRNRDKLKLETLLAYGRVCACCGESEIVFLTIDHINGDGAVERREKGYKGGSSQYRALRQQGFPPGYRVLCWNCNCAIGILGYCPHGTLKPSAVRVFDVSR